MTAPTKCAKCGEPIIFAATPRGRWVPLDAKPRMMAVPVEPGELGAVPPSFRRVRQQPVYEPHFRSCVQSEHVGRAGYVAGEDAADG